MRDFFHKDRGENLKNEVSIDWLSFTLKCTSQEDFKLNKIMELQKKLFLDFVEVPMHKNGRYAYSNAIDYRSSVTILYNDISDKDFTSSESSLDRYLKMGIHIEASGNGCRMIEQHLKERNMSFRDYLLYLKTQGVNFSRIDIAYDDYAQMLDFDVIEDKMRNNLVVSQLRNKQQVDGYAKIESLNTLHKSKTLYFGSRGSSGVLIRFYDKLAEQLSKNNAVDENIKSWQRYEIVLKKEKANDFVTRYENCEDLGRLYLQIISGLIRFVDDTDENKSRCETSQFWKDFIANEEAIKLATRDVDTDIFGMIDWLDRAVMNNLIVLLAIAENENIDLVGKLAESGRMLNAKQENMLNEYFRKDEEHRRKVIERIEKIFKKI